MINSLAISLIFTSLLAAQVWSPNPAGKKQHNNHKEDVIVKEGHRVIVVESFDQNGHHNTKVSISPPQDPISSVDGKFPSGLVENARDKIKQGISSAFDHNHHKFPGVGEGHNPGELINDAFEKAGCKDRMAKVSEKAHEAKEVVEDAYGKAKEKAAEKTHEAKGSIEDAYGKARDTAAQKVHGAKVVVEDAYGKAKETATEKSQGAKEAVQDAYGKAKGTTTEKSQGAKEAVQDAYGKVRETVSEKAHGAKVVVEDAYEKTKDFAAHKAHDIKDTSVESLKQAKDTAKTTKDVGKTIRCDTATNVSKQVGNLKNFTRRAASGIFRSVEDGVKYVSSLEWVDPLMGVTNLLGFSTAYGMGMWVTFVASHVLAGSLPRHQFGLVQSKMYPVYFRAMGLSMITALLGHIGVNRRELFSGGKAERLQIWNLLTSLLMVGINAFYLEPLATKVMFEKFRLEKEEGRGREMEAPETSREEEAVGATAIAEAEAEEQEIMERMGRMNERLKRLNSYSAFLNILTLMGLSWHLVNLGRCVHAKG